MRQINFERAYFAVVIASGLISTHGVDHGGVEPAVIADKAVAIADAIIGAVTNEPPSPPSEAGDAGSGEPNQQTGERTAVATIVDPDPAAAD